MDEILDFLKREDADVVLMQEVYDGHDPAWERKFRSMDVLREEPRYPHEHFAPAFLERTDFGKVEQGNAVLSKWPILESQVYFFDQPTGDGKDDRRTSFNMRHKTNPGFATAVVDMLFVSSSLTVLEHRQCDDNVSDHLALTATIEV